MKKLTPMLEQYFAIKDQCKDAVLFFQMGDFYEMFGDDAVETARLLNLTLTARGKGTENELPMCGVPIHAGTGYIAKLTKMGKKVAICDQVTPPGTGIVRREVTRVVTPGTTFDDTVLDEKASNFLCAVVVDGKRLAFAVVDITTGLFQVGDCKNESELVQLVGKLRASEIIGNGLNDDLRAQLSYNAFVTDFAVPSWKKPESVIREHFETIGLESFGIADDDLLQRVAANMLAYLQETQKSSLGHIRNIELYKKEQYMMLDESTIRNLELFYNQQTGDVQGSLVKAIDETRTAMGGRLLRWWIAHPLVDKGQIEQRLVAVEAFVGKPDVLEQMREHLRSVCDLERLVGKIGTQRANPRDLYNLKETLLKVQPLKETLGGLVESSSLLNTLHGQLHDHTQLIDVVQKTLVDEPPVLMQDGGYIREGISDELDELRKLSTSGKEWINDLQMQERERTGVNSLKVKYNKVFGYYIEVSRANLAAVPENYIRKQTLVNAERFITPELKEYEEKVLGAQDKILQIEEELFGKLREEVFAHVQALQETAGALAAIDVLSSFAFLARTRNYCRPELVDDDVLEVKQGRHAVIEQIEDGYVANDLAMDAARRFMLLTGPNMGGKSSYLRQNAVMVLLAQVGCFVPAAGMRWGIVDRVFTRVGASDNLARGRSTFMVEMQEAAYILNNVTERSLVILDELGRGTSTYDGLSLSWAITEYLHDSVKCKTLFATHYHELIEVVDELKCARNFSVAVADEGEHVVFLHQVLEGGVNRSYGIEVAKLAGIPPHLIFRAKDLLVKLEKHAWEKNSGGRQPTLPLMPVAKPADHPIVKKMRELDPMHLTPMQALQLLMEWKGQVGE